MLIEQSGGRAPTSFCHETFGMAPRSPRQRFS